MFVLIIISLNVGSMVSVPGTYSIDKPPPYNWHAFALSQAEWRKFKMRHYPG